MTLLTETDEQHNTPYYHVVKMIWKCVIDVFDDDKLNGYKGDSFSTSIIWEILNAIITATNIYKNATSSDHYWWKINSASWRIPGCIRIDTIKQSNLDKEKGVFHINATDEITQFEIVCSVEKKCAVIDASTLTNTRFFILAYLVFTVAPVLNMLIAASQNYLRSYLFSSPMCSKHSKYNALADNKHAFVARKIFGHPHIHNLRQT